jgi:hypothetical protein
MEFTGRVEQVVDKSGTSKKMEPFTAYQLLVEEVDGQYPQSGCFDIFGEKIAPPMVGELVTISFSMKANLYEGKIFGKNNVWKIKSERTDNEPIGKKPEAQMPSAGEPTPQNKSDDLPF